jgi:hypothetical protein
MRLDHTAAPACDHERPGAPPGLLFADNGLKENFAI